MLTKIAIMCKLKEMGDEAGRVDLFRPNVYLVRSDGVACRKISDEILLVPIRTSPQQKLGVYTLNRTASILWECLDSACSVEDLICVLIDRFSIDPEMAKNDVLTFCRELLSFGAIEVLESDKITKNDHTK
jgi:hypothetical protein